MKRFIKERSKILLIATILSLILFVLCIPELINYSKSINEEQLLFNQYMLGTSSANIDTMALVSADFLTITLFYNLIMFGLLMVASAFNIVGYVYKKLEFQLISIVFFTINLFTNLYLMDIGGILVFSLLIILNIFGYVGQYKIQKKMTK